MKYEKLESLYIDVEKDIYKVNGRDISKSGHYLNLTFENGEWSLMITEDLFFSTSDQQLYISERIVNIAELENHIEKAYLSSVALEKELHDNKPDMKKILELSSNISVEICGAYKFEFLIERRKTIV